MLRLFFLFGLPCLAISLESCGPAAQAQAPTPEYTLAWADEFETPGSPDPAHWDYDLGNACDLPAGCGWGNNELQSYSLKPENVRIEGGLLVIEARKAQEGFSSARLVTRDKAAFTYGRIEIRAKLPAGRGTWPAIWMLPQNDTYGGWPASGEIDIMEHVGFNPDTIFGTPHTKAFNHMIGTHQSGAIYLPDAETEFHTYAVEWNGQQIDWFVDDTHYHRFAPTLRSSAEWPFDHPFYLILNLAVGGNWGGKEGIDDSIWPQQFLIDYVRVYTKNSKDDEDD